MQIDLSELSDDKRNSPEVLQLCEQVRRNSDPQQIKAVCVHEAAHGIYMLRAGAIRLERRGMKIGYDDSAHEYFISPAAVKPVFPAHWLAELEAVARCHAAGGVAMRKLTAETNVGDEKDYEDFCRFCSDFFPASSTESRSRWEKAQRQVEEDLRSPQFRKTIWEKAREFELWLLSQSR